MPIADHLNSLATDRGILAVLAIDHRDSLLVALKPDDPGSVPTSVVVEFKQDIVRGASPAASGVMLEPEYSIPGLVGDLAPGVGFFAALEAQGYGDDPYVRVTDLLDGWSVEQAIAAGASGAKLLIFYTPDVPEAADVQDALVRRVATECAVHGFPFLLEPLAYPSSPQAAANPVTMRMDHRRLVLETAKRLTGLGATIMKMQFPADPVHDPESTWSDACAEMDDIIVEPWALLSAGVDFDTFATQVEVASRAGASGFMVGRAAWGELAGLAREDRIAGAATVVRDRVARLREIADTHGRPWSEAPLFHG